MVIDPISYFSGIRQEYPYESPVADSAVSWSTVLQVPFLIVTVIRKNSAYYIPSMLSGNIERIPRYP